MVSNGLRLLIALVWFLPLPGHASKQSVWKEYTSQHFVLYSDRPSSEAVSVLKDFERFREAALLLVGRTDTDEGEKTQIYLFGDAQLYSLIQADTEVAGFYRDTLQGARMVVGAESNLQDASLVLFHEYAHHITRSRSRIQYPLWYDEGFADVLASAEIGSQDVVIGLANSWREEIIKKQPLLPLAELFVLPIDKNEVYWDRYYASAWIFMHYLQLHYIRGDQEKTDQLKRFLVALHRGDKPLKVFPKIFDMPVQKMEEELREYARLRYWKGYRIDISPYRGRISSRRLNHNERAFLLGDLAYRSGQEEGALELLQYVDASQSGLAPALSLRAVLESHRGNIAVGRHYLALAQKMEPDNAFVATNAAHFYWDLVQLYGQDRTSEAMTGLLQKVTDFSQAALKVEPQNVEAGRFLARSLRRMGRFERAINVLLNIHERRPTDLHVNFELGKLLLEAGRPQRSRPYLKNVAAWDHSPARKNAALKLLKDTHPSETVQLSELDPDLTLQFSPNLP